MSESLVLRNEHSRSLADAERFRALDTLTELGVLVPFDQAGVVGEEGNTAQLVSPDSDARILDASFDPHKLDPADSRRYHTALKGLTIPMTSGSPVGFRSRNIAAPLIAQIEKKGKQFITGDDVNGLLGATDDAELVNQLAGAHNALQLALVNPGALATELLEAQDGISDATVIVDGQELDAPLNLEYAARYMQQAHIVGAKIEGQDSAVLFEAEKAQPPETLQQDRERVWKRLGALTNLVEAYDTPFDRKSAHSFMHTLEDAHAKPEQLMADARTVPGYAEIFDADAANMEGYTLGEHTETVLRNFEENYADRLPVELLKLMRLAIVSHDIGKPLAAANRQKHKQKEYNLAQATDFFDKLGVDPRAQGLMLAMIGEGQKHAYRIDVKRDGDVARAEMRQFAEKTIQEFTGSEQVSTAQVEAFEAMCMMLHTVDGGAYTSMAVTRRDDGVSYRNNPFFNGTFAQPTDRGKRGLTVRRQDQAFASADLTPHRKGYVEPVPEPNDDIL
jgi:hypothetical protein